MKASRKLILLGLTALLGLTSCLNLSEQVTCSATVALGSTSLEFTADGEATGYAFVNVVSNSDWLITNPTEYSWVKFDRTEGKNNKPVRIGVLPWTEATDRTATIKFATLEDCAGTGTKEVILTITQKASAVTLDVEWPTTTFFASAGGSKIITVTTNSPWKAAVSANELLLTPVRGEANEPAGTEITATYGANTSPYHRASTVTVTAQSKSANKEFIQYGCAATVDAIPNIDFALATGQTLNRQVITNVKPEHISVISCPDWISYEREENILKFTAKANTATIERAGTITVKCNASDEYIESGTENFATTSFNVSQPAADKFFILDQTAFSVNEEEQTIAISYTINDDATITSAVASTGSEWLSVGTTTYASANVTISQNTALAPAEGRDGAITLTVEYADGTTSTKTVTIHQDVATTTLSASMDFYTTDYKKHDNLLLEANTNAAVTDYASTIEVTDDADWLTFKSSLNSCGSGYFDIFFDVEKNNSTEDRIANITVSVGPEGNRKEQTIQFTQTGCPEVSAVFTPTSLTFEYDNNNVIGKAIRISDIKNPTTTVGSLNSVYYEPDYPFIVEIDYEGDVADTFSWENVNHPWSEAEPYELYGIKVYTTKDNTTNADWKATLTVTVIGDCAENTQVTEIALTQLCEASCYVTATPDALTFNAADQLSQSITITTLENINWNLTIPAEYPWVSADKLTGVDDETVVLTLLENKSANNRTAVLRLDAEGTDGNKAFSYITIVQKSGADANLTVTPATLDIPTEGGTFTFNVASNAEWTATIAVNTASVFGGFEVEGGTAITTSGNGNATVTVSITPNNNIDPREISIAFQTIPNSPWNPNVAEDAVTLTQAGAEEVTLVLNPASLALSAAAYTGISIEGTSNSTWIMVSASDTWITLPTTIQEVIGNGAAGLITIAANPSYTEARIGCVTFAVGTDPSNQKTVTLPIVQEPKKAFAVTPTTIELPYAGGTATFAVAGANDATYTVVPGSTWVTLPTGTQTLTAFTISVEKNPSSIARETVVTVTNTGDNAETISINITQEASPAITLSVTPEEYPVLPAVATTLNPQVTSNSDWEVRVESPAVAEGETVEMLHVNTADYSISVSDNMTGAQRMGEIVYSAGQGADYVEVGLPILQAAHYLIPALDELHIPMEGVVSKYISVESDCEYMVEVSYPESTEAISYDPDDPNNWISIEGSTWEPGQGQDEGREFFGPNKGFSISVDPNNEHLYYYEYPDTKAEGSQKRTAEIVITGGGVQYIITVTQDAWSDTIEVEPTAIVIGPEGGERHLSILGNQAFLEPAIYCYEEWVNYDDYYDTDDSYIRVNIDPNTTGKERYTELTIAFDLTNKIVIPITQAGDPFTLTVSTNDVSFSKDGGTTYVYATTNEEGGLDITENPDGLDWIDHEINTDGTIAITTEENTTGKDRTMQYVVSTETQTSVINVTQSGEAFYTHILSEDLEFGNAAASSATVDIQTNEPAAPIITLSTGAASWLQATVDASSISGKTRIRIETLSLNNTGQDRVGTITLTGANSQASLTVTQHADEYFFTITPATLTVSGDDELEIVTGYYQYVVDVNTNIPDWKNKVRMQDLAARATWCDIETLDPDPNDDNDNSVLGINSISENLTHEKRSTSILIYLEGTEYSQTFTFEQNPLSDVITTNPDAVLNVPAGGSDNAVIAVTVDEGLDWKVKEDANWIEVNPEGGLIAFEGPNTLSFTIAANNTSEDREADLVIFSTAFDDDEPNGFVSKTIKVFQPAASGMKVKYNNVVIDNGGTITIPADGVTGAFEIVPGNVDEIWHAYKSDTDNTVANPDIKWFDFTHLVDGIPQGIGNSSLSFAIHPNPEAAARRMSIIIKNEADTQTYRVEIEQAGGSTANFFTTSLDDNSYYTGDGPVTVNFYVYTANIGGIASYLHTYDGPNGESQYNHTNSYSSMKISPDPATAAHVTYNAPIKYDDQAGPSESGGNSIADEYIYTNDSSDPSYLQTGYRKWTITIPQGATGDYVLEINAGATADCIPYPGSYRYTFHAK